MAEKDRITEIDFLKGVLTLSMIFAHTAFILKRENINQFDPILLFFYLADFSGFLFCFGYVFWFAYLFKDKFPVLNIIKTAIKCYCAFVFSGISFRLLVSNEEPTFKLVKKIVFIQDVPSFSEFLLTFLLVTLLTLIFFRQAKFVSQSIYRLLFFSAICLGITYFPMESNQFLLVAQIFPIKGSVSFPLVSYLPIFLGGIFVARTKLKYSYALFWIMGLFVTLLSLSMNLNLEMQRFPPSPFWILSSAVIVYIFCGLSKILFRLAPTRIVRQITRIGEHVLYYLLISNLTLFLMCAFGAGSSYDSKKIIIVYCLTVPMFYFIRVITDKIEKM